MAAAWGADTLNYGKLKAAFPEIIEELEKICFNGDKSLRENHKKGGIHDA